MNPYFIRFLDQAVGKPICLALSAWDRLWRYFFESEFQKPKKIVFVKLIEMGSSVLAASAFSKAVELVGKENVYILVFKKNRPILDLLPYFKPENILTIEDSTLFQFIPSLLRRLFVLRREKVDSAIDLEGMTRSSAIITYLTGAKNRVGFYNFTSEGPYRGRLFTHEVQFNFYQHMAQSFLSLVKVLESNKKQVPYLKDVILREEVHIPPFFPTPEDQQGLEKILKIEGLPTESAPLCILNPNCSDLLPNRKWEESKFIELGKKLLDHFPQARILLTGAPNETQAAKKIAVSIGERCLCLAGKTTLRQLLTLYHRCDLLISNDSGPPHFAAMTPIHILALFGPETPKLYSPWGPRVSCLSLELNCSPCVSILNHRFSPCQNNLCMKEMPVERVFEMALAVLEKREKNQEADRPLRS